MRFNNKGIRVEQRNVSVKTVLDDIADGRYYLPIVQRDYIWDSAKAADLLDSMMKGYVMNSITLWNTSNEILLSSSAPLNRKASVKDDVYYIVDGQQRLTSLYYALSGLRDKGVDNRDIFIKITDEGESGVSDTVYVSTKKGFLSKYPDVEFNDENYLTLDFILSDFTPKTDYDHRLFYIKNTVRDMLMNYSLQLSIQKANNRGEDESIQLSEQFSRLNQTQQGFDKHDIVNMFLSNAKTGFSYKSYIEGLCERVGFGFDTKDTKRNVIAKSNIKHMTELFINTYTDSYDSNGYQKVISDKEGAVKFLTEGHFEKSIMDVKSFLESQIDVHSKKDVGKTIIMASTIAFKYINKNKYTPSQKNNIRYQLKQFTYFITAFADKSTGGTQTKHPSIKFVLNLLNSAGDIPFEENLMRSSNGLFRIPSMSEINIGVEIARTPFLVILRDNYKNNIYGNSIERGSNRNSETVDHIFSQKEYPNLKNNSLNMMIMDKSLNSSKNCKDAREYYANVTKDMNESQLRVFKDSLESQFIECDESGNVLYLDNPEAFMKNRAIKVYDHIVNNLLK